METDYHAFIIRVWSEGTGEDNTKVWRGYIEHVNHDSRMYFSDLNGIARFIEVQIGIPSIESGFRWRAWLSSVTHAVTGAARKIHL